MGAPTCKRLGAGLARPKMAPRQAHQAEYDDDYTDQHEAKVAAAMTAPEGARDFDCFAATAGPQRRWGRSQSEVSCDSYLHGYGTHASRSPECSDHSAPQPGTTSLTLTAEALAATIVSRSGASSSNVRLQMNPLVQCDRSCNRCGGCNSCGSCNSCNLL